MNDLDSRIPQFIDFLQSIINEEINKCAEGIYNDTQQACPVITGALKASGYNLPIFGGRKVGYDIRYAIWVEYRRNFFRPIVLKWEQKLPTEIANRINFFLGG
jgi:hypothetical protein